MAIALGWAFAEIFSLRLVKILTTEFYADEFRFETLIISFTSLFDFLRIVGVTFFVEKITRRDSKFTLFLTIFIVTLLSELSNYLLTEEQDRLSEARKRAILGSES